MNCIFRTLWSAATQSWQAVPETAKSAGKGGGSSRKSASKSSASGMVSGVALGLMASGGVSAQAPPQPVPAPTQLPTGGKVTQGVATLSQTTTAQAAALTVTQSSQRAVVNWDTFNLGSAARVNFAQPNAQAVTLNRVNDANPSQIFGRITAPGQVVLTNAQGIYFSPTAQVDVGGLVATTHSISDDNFMAGNTRFERNGATGKVVNDGQLNAALGGYIALLAPEVQNAGVVVAQAGTVAMATGDAITLNFAGNRTLASITTTLSTLATLVNNQHAVMAPDGQIILSAVALNKLQAGVVKNSGTLEANSLVSKGGKIVLEGDDITLTRTSKIDAKGALGGGTVLVGGDWQGSGNMRQATKVTMEAGASIDASATDRGDGGKVVLWSDVHNAESVTKVGGRIETKGAGTGNGGQIETSGYLLQVDDTVQIDTGSGQWLLDPYDVTISSASGSGTSLASSTYTANANDAVVNVTALQTALNASQGATVTIATGSSGSQSGNIIVGTDITWTTGSILSLQAAGGVTGSATITTGTSSSYVLFDQVGNSTYSGVIAGAGGVRKSGVGTLALTGNNSYNGVTGLLGGKLSMGSATALGTTNMLSFVGGTLQYSAASSAFDFTTGPVRTNSVASNYSIDTNGQNVTLAGTLVAMLNTGSLTKLGTGTLTLTASNGYYGATTISEGTLALSGAGSLGNAGGSGTTVASGAVLDLQNKTNVQGYITLNGGTLKTSTGTSSLFSSGAGVTLGASGGIIDVATGATLTIPVAISGASASLTKAGGGTLSLTGTNTYSGNTNLNGGVLSLGSTGAMGTTGSISFFGGGLKFTSSNVTDYSSRFSTSPNQQYSFDTNGQSVTLASNLTSAGASLTKLGSGTLTFNGANTYSGGTTITTGTLLAGSATALGSGDISIASGGALDLNGQAMTSTGLLTLRGTGVSTTGALMNSSTTAASYAGLVALGANSLIVGGTGAIGLTHTGTITGAYGLTLGGALGGSIAGALGTSTGTLTKQDAGTWELMGPNTYSGGTTLTAGVLQVDAANGLGSGVVSFGGGTLKYGIGTNTDYSTQFSTTGTQAYKVDMNGQSVTWATALTSSAGSLTVAGSGTLTVSGANTYSGTTNINGGTLKLGSASPWGSSVSVVTVANGGVLDLNGQSVLATNGLTINGTGISSGGALINSSTNAASYAGLLKLGSASSIVGGAGSINLSNTGTITGATFGLTLGGTQGGTLASILGTSTGTLTKTGSGTWAINGASTYIGATAINEGTLKIGAAAALGNGGAVTVASGGVLDLNGQTPSNTPSLTINGSGISNGGALINSSSTAASYGGSLILGSDSSIVGDAGLINLTKTNNNLTNPYTLTLGGAQGGALASGLKMGVGSLVKDGAGTWSLQTSTTAPTYTGTTTVNNGVLYAVSLSGANALGTGDITVAQGGVLQLNGNLSNAIQLNGGTLRSYAAPATFNGNVTLGAASTTDGAYDLVMNGVISGAYNLTKAGAGALTLVNTNTYTGNTNITVGTIKLGTTTPWVTGAGGMITVSNGAGLDLNGKTVISTNPLTLNGKLQTYSGALTNTYGTGVASYAGQITLGSDSTIGGAGGINLTSPNAITGAYDLTLTATLTAPVNTISSAIATGTGGLKITTLSTANSWLLTGANTYTGNTSVTVGTLKLGTANPWGSGGSVSITGTNAALDLNGQTIVPTNPLTINGTGISNGGALFNSSLTGASYGGLLTLGGASSIVGDTGSITLSNTGTISGAFGLTLGGTQGGSLASILGTTTGTLTKAGTGTWTLGGLNTFTGNTNISAGVLKLGSTTPWGSTGTVSITSGAALDLNGQTVVVGSSRGLTLNGTGIVTGSSNSGVLFNSSSTAASYGGLLTLGSASSIVGDTGSITLSNAGTVSGNFNLTLGGAQGGTLSSILGIGTGTLTKVDTGTWTLGGLNTFTGNTTISAGTLKLGSATPWGGTGTLSVTSGAALDLNGQTVVAGSARALTLNGTGVSGSGALFNSSSTAASYGGLVTLGSATTILGDTGAISLSNTGTTSGTYALTLGGAQGGTFSSILGMSTGTLTKTGAGTWKLTGTNTYTGATTISAGILQLSGTGGIASSASVTNSGTLDISFTTSGASINLLSGGGGVTLGSKTLTLSGTSTFDGVISGTGGLNVAEFGVVTLTADQTYTGTTTMVGNVLGSSLTLGNGGTGGSLAGAISMSNSGSSLTVNRSTDTTLPGIITGMGVLKKFGTGTLTLSGTNSTLNGVVNINAGTLKLGSSTPWGLPATQNVTVSAGASLDLSGFSIASTSRTLNLNGTGVNGGGALLNSGSTAASYAGVVTLGSATSIVGDTGSINLTNTGTITGATFGLTLGGVQGGTLASVLGTTTGTLTKTGVGTWTLTGVNTYTGSTTINAGTLQVGTLASTTARLGTGTTIADNGNLVFIRSAGFSLSAMLPTVGTTITGTGNVTVQGNGTVNVDRAITLTGASSVIKVLAGAASGANTSLVSDLTLTSTLTTSATGTIAIFAGSPTATVANGSTTNLGLKMAGATGGIQYKTYNATSASLSSSVVGTRNFYYRVLPSISVTGATVSAAKTYDGNTTATNVTVTGGSSTGSIDGDLMGLSATSATYAAASVATGIGMTVNLVASSTSPSWVVSGYAATLSGGTVSGTITKAPLVIQANDDARFVTQTDAVGYAGVSYSGFVNNETSSVLVGSAAIARSSPSATAAGSYTLTPSGFTATNYDITYRTGTYTIVPANQLLVRVADSISTYGNTPTYTVTSAKYVMPDNTLVDLTGNLSVMGGLYMLNDGASGNAQFALGLNSPTLSTAGKPVVGIWNVAASGATTTSANFSNTLTLVGTQTIQPRSLTVTASASDKAYDGGVSATVTLNDNRVVGDVLSTSQTAATFASKNAATGLMVTVNGITATGADMGNYSLLNTSATASAAITPKALSLSGLSAAAKVYDGGTSVTMNSYGALSGAVGIDDVQVDATGVSAAFATKTAGIAKTVNISGLILGGADMANYSLANPFTTTANIAAKPLTVTGTTVANKVYDATTTATLTNGALQGVVVGDAVTLTQAGNFSDKNYSATSKTVTANDSLLGADKDNYTLTQPTGLTASISKADLSISGVSAVDRTYNATNVASLSGTPSVVPLLTDAVTVSGTPSATFADKNFGTNKPVTVSGYTLMGTDSGNYNPVQPTGLTASISKANLSVTGVTAVDKVYDATTVGVLTGTATVAPLLTDNVTVTGTPVATFADKNASVSAIGVGVTGYTFGGTDGGNYNVVQPTGLSALISKKPLVMTGLSTGQCGLANRIDAWCRHGGGWFALHG
jgi:fibronectin-binding autotransporter adhesin